MGARKLNLRHPASILLVLLLAACGADEERLPGERIPVRAESGGVVQRAGDLPVTLGAAIENAEWTHAGRTAARNPGHVALPVGLTRVFRADIGRGGLSGGGVVVADGRVFAFDGGDSVAAFSPAGARLWTTGLRPASERSDGFGGGIAHAGGLVFVTTGYGEVVALDPGDGAIRWRAGFDAPFRSAPVSDGQRVIAVSRADEAVALDAGTGRTIWRVQAAAGGEGLPSTADPVLFEGVALLPSSNGEVTAVLAGNGRRLWTSSLGSGRRDLARSAIVDVSAAPIISGTSVYFGNEAGTTQAADTRSGQAIWTAPEGAADTMAIAGQDLFQISDRRSLLRLSAVTGEVIWAQPLDGFVRRAPASWRGPILAGGRLLVLSSEGDVLSIAPEDGSLVQSGSLGIAPQGALAIAGGRLYVVASGGRLYGFE